MNYLLLLLLVLLKGLYLSKRHYGHNAFTTAFHSTQLIHLVNLFIADFSYAPRMLTLPLV